MAQGDMTDVEEAKRAEAAKLKSLYRMMGAEERAKPASVDTSRRRPSFTLPSFRLPPITLPAFGRTKTAASKKNAAREIDLGIGKRQSGSIRPAIESRSTPVPSEVERPTVAAATPRGSVSEPAISTMVPTPAPAPKPLPDGKSVPEAAPRAKISHIAMPELSMPRVSLPKLSLPRLPSIGKTGGAIAAGGALVLAVGVAAVEFWPSPAPMEPVRNAVAARTPVVPVAAPVLPPPGQIAPPVEPAIPAPPLEVADTAPAPVQPPVAEPSSKPEPAAVFRTSTARVGTPARPRTAVASAARPPETPAARPTRPHPVADRPAPPRSEALAVDTVKPAAPSAGPAPSIGVNVAQLNAADTNPVYLESKNVVQVDKKQARKAARAAASDAIRTLRLR